MADADHEYAAGHGLAEALRGLPDAAPEPDLWPALAAQLQAGRVTAAPPRRRHWHLGAGLALAASLIIAAMLPWSPSRRVDDGVAMIPTTTSTTPDSAIADLGWMRQRSTQLESWLSDLPTPSVRDGRALMATVEIEDLIALVDVQLGATRGTEDALPLWRQRVALLEELSVLRSAAFGVASIDPNRTGGDSAPVLL